jgi:murein L,D-transpeptidase YafK
VRVENLPAFFLLIILFFHATPAFAWSPGLTGDSFAPEVLLAVDKQDQNFLVFSNKSPLRKEYSWQCTTGQVHGDKLVEGDLKTPEGIYFLERRISANLPFDLYGELAFTLNYPNPIDRIKQKSGHSIWIHGRGKEVVPYDTEGCVAMKMDYMLALENIVSLQKTPVIIAENIAWEPVETASENSAGIVHKTLQWAGDWQAKSDRYFEHYDSELYPMSSGQSIDRFRSHKKDLFNRYPWMDVFIDYPRVLEGPDYWVSYFGQVFKAPGFYSAGIKRLYWKEDETGKMRIVGEEWRQYPDVGLGQRYLADRKDSLHELLERWKQSWLAADLEGYGSFYHEGAVQNHLQGAKSIVDHKRDLWDRGSLPETIDLKEINIQSVENGFRMEFVQSYSSIEGYSDYGIKTLTLAPFENEWLIKSEAWSPVK